MNNQCLQKSRLVKEALASLDEGGADVQHVVDLLDGVVESVLGADPSRLSKQQMIDLVKSMADALRDTTEV